jgi:DNA-directed RNA polymerase specialized sigma24 family protein
MVESGQDPTGVRHQCDFHLLGSVMNPTEFQELITRLRKGDEHASKQLMDQYAEAIRREARFALLDKRLRRISSESDVCQSVMMRFMVGMWAGRYEIDSPAQLEALLKGIVRNRVADLARHWRAQRRDVRRDSPTGSNLGLIHRENEASPSDLVSNQELLAEFRRRLATEDLSVLRWRQEGISWPEIASRVGATSAEAIRKHHERAVAKILDELDCGPARG